MSIRTWVKLMVVGLLTVMVVTTLQIAFQLTGLKMIWSLRCAYAQNGTGDLAEIVGGVEKRYSGVGLSADFKQTSTLKMMQIKDQAVGQALFKRPGKMRWEYASPEKQTIITDGYTLWVYRPDDNQVMLGRFPSFFGEGKGGSFLADMGQVRQKFDIDLKQSNDPDHYLLSLTPKQPSAEIHDISILVHRQTFVVDQIRTYNAYGDETRITFSNVRFMENIDDRNFNFKIPEEADVIKLD